MGQSSKPTKVLIVEDDNAKAKALRECATAAGFKEEDVLVTDTIVVASQLIDSESFVGIILDLAFHSTQQSEHQAERTYLAGVSVLQQLEEMRIATPVIVATQHKSFESSQRERVQSVEDLAKVLQEAFDETLKEFVEVDLRNTRWKHQLIEGMRRWFR